MQNAQISGPLFGLFFSLFFSSTLLASTYQPTRVPAKKSNVVTCSGTYEPASISLVGSGATFGECAAKISPAISGAIVLPKASETIDMGFQTMTINRSFEALTCGESSCSVGFKITSTSTTSMCVGGPNGQPVCSTSPPSTSVSYVSGQVQKTGERDGFLCPPDNYPLYTLGPIVEGTENFCENPAPPPPPCPSVASSEVNFWFGPKGGGTACVLSDDDSLCPYREEGNSGYYVADVSNPNACDGKSPTEPPKDDTPDGCDIGGNGSVWCPADPSTKCKTVTPQNAAAYTTCPDTCGMLNGKFMCSTTPPKIPPLTDLQVDDEVENPNKPLADMIKGDFKDVLSGLETRIDGLKTIGHAGAESNQQQLGDIAALQKSTNKSLDGISESMKGLQAGTDTTNASLENIISKLEGDEFSVTAGIDDELKTGLGVDGSESIGDLELGEVSLDSMNGQFSPFLSSGSCPADRSISLLGKSYSLSWSSFCNFFSMLSILVMAAAYIAVPFIVFGGRK